MFIKRMEQQIPLQFKCFKKKSLYNLIDYYYEVSFNYEPPEGIKRYLRAYGFKWNRRNKLWRVGEGKKRGRQKILESIERLKNYVIDYNKGLYVEIPFAKYNEDNKNGS